MKKQKTSAWAYLYKNFFGIAVFSIIPALVLGYCRQDAKRADFLVSMLKDLIPSDRYMTYLVKSFSIVGVGESFPLLALGAFLAIVSLSLLLSKVNRHMHLGVSSIRGIFRQSLSNVLKVGTVVVFFIAIEIVLNLLVIGLMYFVSMLPSPFWRDVILIVFIALNKLLLGYLICLCCCALPAAEEEGYKLNIASSYSVRLISRDTKYLWGFMFAYLASHFAVLLLCGLFDIWMIQVAICTIYYFAWISIGVPMFCAKYIEVSNGERRDISKSYF